MKLIFSERNEKSGKIYKCECGKETEKDVTHVSSIERTKFFTRYEVSVLFGNEELILTAVNE